MSSSLYDDLTELERNEYARLLSLVRSQREAFAQVLQAVIRIRDARLYRESYGSFAAFCEHELRMSRANIDKLNRAAESLSRVKEVDPALEVRVKSLDAALALQHVPQEHIADVVREADTGHRLGVTAPAIQDAAKKIVPPPPPHEVVQPIFPELQADVLDRHSIQKLRILNRVFKRIGSIDQQAEFLCRHFNELAVRIAERVSDQ